MYIVNNSSIFKQNAVTTCVNDTAQLIDEARSLALSLNAPYYSRNDISINELFRTQSVDRVLIVRRDQYSLREQDGTEYLFHPNLALVRAENYKKAKSDHYIEAAEFKSGDKVIDCTLGFGTEAILAAMQVGPEGQVIGLESVPELAVLTRSGMGRYQMLQKPIQEAMRRVIVLNCDYREYLRLSQTHSADIVYFDPFFSETLEGSAVTVNSLAAFGNRSPLDVRSITEARRVARRWVIVKHPKWQMLPREVSAQAKDQIAGRRSPIEYVRIPPFSSSY